MSIGRGLGGLAMPNAHRLDQAISSDCNKFFMNTSIHYIINHKSNSTLLHVCDSLHGVRNNTMTAHTYYSTESAYAGYRLHYRRIPHTHDTPSASQDAWIRLINV